MGWGNFEAEIQRDDHQVVARTSEGSERQHTTRTHHEIHETFKDRQGKVVHKLHKSLECKAAEETQSEKERVETQSEKQQQQQQQQQQHPENHQHPEKKAQVTVNHEIQDRNSLLSTSKEEGNEVGLAAKKPDHILRVETRPSQQLVDQPPSGGTCLLNHDQFSLMQLLKAARAYQHLTGSTSISDPITNNPSIPFVPKNSTSLAPLKARLDPNARFNNRSDPLRRGYASPSTLKADIPQSPVKNNLVTSVKSNEAHVQVPIQPKVHSTWPVRVPSQLLGVSSWSPPGGLDIGSKVVWDAETLDNESRSQGRASSLVVNIPRIQKKVAEDDFEEGKEGKQLSPEN
ncbi:hypothetical protein K504DRAFT_538660 [Pleomassaria siparia CBS 279.74]|uniref:Uncharacterized protein n=1 Tax=Pleomassaria siparia CBS 279.74 TaxID=1314801 RepID=A0A6G1JTC0_9PLEO|nr:hypothetical protein K504DRAFT_538660 [Pleomassaria siparia CBS 279.74]